jgi:L-alanine-DL-glutamate epimerase-like enolase superfamily enzyme
MHMKIIDIQSFPIAMPLSARYQKHDGQIRMHDIDEHLVVKVTTDNGIVGYGDDEDAALPIPQKDLDRLIDQNPFNFLQNNLHKALGMALYDVMGKYLEVPAYKLMGQKVRDAVPVAAWTRPCAPEVFAEEIQRAAQEGYRIYKMHSSPFYDVIEQTKAASDVAPPGFKIHWDFNHNRTIASVLPIIKELEKYPVVGYIEDPLPWTDIDGWRTLRAKTSLPIIMHSPPLGGIQEVILGCADIYMIGRGGIGNTLQEGFAYGKANTQTLIQQSGNSLMTALSLHEAAVLPTATAHIMSLSDQYEDDYTTKRIPVMDGFSQVPEAPGLGLDIDEAKLKEAAERRSIQRPKFIGILNLAGGTRIFTPDGGGNVCGPANHDAMRYTGYEEGALRGIRLERWVDDGSEEFRKASERIQKEGAYIEHGS